MRGFRRFRHGAGVASPDRMTTLFIVTTTVAVLAAGGFEWWFRNAAR